MTLALRGSPRFAAPPIWARTAPALGHTHRLRWIAIPDAKYIAVIAIKVKRFDLFKTVEKPLDFVSKVSIHCLTEKIMKKIKQQLIELEAMDIKQLQQLWWEYFKQPPQRLRREYLIAEIGYKIQQKAYGGLSKTIKNKLERLAFEEQKTSQPKFKLSAGTKLVREWSGKQHIVVVLEEGFEYQQQKYKSLSKIASEITGAKWSGPLFFGLKKQGGKNEKAA